MGISKGRLSQILKTGDINFTVGKIVKIALAMDMFPNFGLMKKDDYYQREEESASTSKKMTFNSEVYNVFEIVPGSKGLINSNQTREKEYSY